MLEEYALQRGILEIPFWEYALQRGVLEIPFWGAVDWLSHCGTAGECRQA